MPRSHRHLSLAALLSSLAVTLVLSCSGVRDDEDALPPLRGHGAPGGMSGPTGGNGGPTSGAASSATGSTGAGGNPAASAAGAGGAGGLPLPDAGMGGGDTGIGPETDTPDGPL